MTVKSHAAGFILHTSDARGEIAEQGLIGGQAADREMRL